MKKAIYSLLMVCCINTAANAQNFLDNYIGAVVTPTVIANNANQVNQPQDLDFKPNTNELWIANRGTANGGSVVIIYNAGLPNQTSQLRQDSHTGHFMRFPPAIAFGDDGFWACVSEIQSTAGGNSTFMGPALWTGDTAITGRVFQNNWVNGLPLGSHYDMLHQSPFAMGIAHDSALAYWVNDGHNGNICLYDFVQHHGPGYDNHSAGKIWRYIDVTVTRVANIPSHMILDKATGWLYFIDGGTKKIKRMNTNTGNITGALNVPATASEPLASYQKVETATVEDLATLATQPCGIDFYKNRLVVSDNTNGNIYIYNTSGVFTLMTTINTGLAGMMGVKVGPDGRIWCVNKTTNTVYRLDATAPVKDVAITSIVSPIVQNFKPNFYSTAFSDCNANITPVATIMNKGTTTITSVSLQYTVNNGAPVTHNWSGSLAAGATANVTFPVSAVVNGNHLLKITAINVNGSPDDVDLNNTMEGSFRTFNPAVNYPYTEDFAAAVFPPANWNVVQYNPNNKMSRVSAGGFGLSTGCMKMDNFSGAEDISGQKDYLISPKINMSTATSGARLIFSVGHAQYDASTNDKLEVLVSTNCGSTWTSIYNKAGAVLSTAPISASAWTPTAAQWRSDTVSMSSYAGQAEVLLAFHTTSNFGNNIYIDDILVNQGPTSVSDLGFDDVIMASPNPVAGLLHLNFKKSWSENISGKIVSFDGKVVREFNLPGNQVLYDIDMSGLSNGVYSLVINTDKTVYSKKIIKQ